MIETEVDHGCEHSGGGVFVGYLATCQRGTLEEEGRAQLRNRWKRDGRALIKMDHGLRANYKERWSRFRGNGFWSRNFMKSVNQSKNNRENMHKVLKVREKVTDIFF